MAPVHKASSTFSGILNTAFHEDKESHDSSCQIPKSCLKLLICECSLKDFPPPPICLFLNNCKHQETSLTGLPSLLINVVSGKKKSVLLTQSEDWRSCPTELYLGFYLWIQIIILPAFRKASACYSPSSPPCNGKGKLGLQKHSE